MQTCSSNSTSPLYNDPLPPQFVFVVSGCVGLPSVFCAIDSVCSCLSQEVSGQMGVHNTQQKRLKAAKSVHKPLVDYQSILMLLIIPYTPSHSPVKQYYEANLS